MILKSGRDPVYRPEELLAAGGTVLAFGLGGGWWLTSRAMRPVDDISVAASRISEGNLSERINVADTDSDGTPDYQEDANGNGSVDSGETDWKNASDWGLRVFITRPKRGANIP